MATRSLGQLTLDLVARIGGFTGPLEKAKRTAKSDMTDIAKSVKTASTAIVGVGTAAAGAATAVVAFTKHASDNARELQNQANLANTSVEEFQRWSYATSSVGVEQDKLADILKDTNDRVGEFLSTGGGEMAEFFEKIAPQIGVTAEQFRNLSGPQALQLYYDSLEKAGLSQQDMTFYMESMADETTALIPLLRDGGAGIAAMGDEADRLGIVLDEVDIAKLTDFANEFDRARKVLGSLANVVAGELAPYMSVLTDYLVDATTGANDIREALPSALRNSVAALGPLLDGFQKFQILDGQVKVGTAEMQLAFADFAEGAWSSVEWFLNTAIAGFNNLIRGINAIPGVDDIEFIGSFSESDFFARIQQQTDDAKAAVVEYRKELENAESQPLWSGVIDDYLADVDAKLAAFRAEQDGIPLKTLDEWLFKPPSTSGIGSGTSVIDDLSDSYQNLLDRLYPVVASQKQFAEEMEQLDLAKKAGDVNDLADAQERLRGSYQSDSTADETYGFMQPDTSGVGMGEDDDDAWSRWLESAENAFTDFDNLNAQVAENFTSRFGDAIEGVVFDYENLGDAAQGVAEGMARSVVNALGQMAAQWLAYQAVQLVVGKTTQASAGMTMAANAQAQSVMAGLNAFTSTAAIPIIGPELAPVAASAAVAATQPMAATVGTLALSGMAHDGIDSVPETGTWLLQQGERVTTSDTSAKLDRTLDNVQAGMNQSGQSTSGASGSPTINVDARGASDPAAIRRAAEQGAEMGYRRVLEDFSSNGPGRRILKV